MGKKIQYSLVVQEKDSANRTAVTFLVDEDEVSREAVLKSFAILPSWAEPITSTKTALKQNQQAVVMAQRQPKFQVGERVRVTDAAVAQLQPLASGRGGSPYAVKGLEFTITKVVDSNQGYTNPDLFYYKGGATFPDGRDAGIWEHFLEPAFRPGDRVRVTSTEAAHPYYHGTEFVIAEVKGHGEFMYATRVRSSADTGPEPGIVLERLEHA